jgi:hypothetical protein
VLALLLTTSDADELRFTIDMAWETHLQQRAEAGVDRWRLLPDHAACHHYGESNPGNCEVRERRERDAVVDVRTGGRVLHVRLRQVVKPGGIWTVVGLAGVGLPERGPDGAPTILDPRGGYFVYWTTDPSTGMRRGVGYRSYEECERHRAKVRDASPSCVLGIVD